MLGGYVTSPRDCIGRNMKFHPDGLFSQKIFGPIKSFQCECGRLRSKVLDSDKVCSHCGVICGPDSLRFETFGKIKLAFNVLNPIKINEFKRLVGRQNEIILNPLRAESLTNEKRFLAIKSDGSQLKIVTELKNEDGFFPIPFRITGIYSLLLCLKYIDRFLNLPIVKNYYNPELILSEIKVLPPGIRPIFVETSGTKNKIQTPEVNKHYISVLQLNKSNAIFTSSIAIDEEDWMAKIHYMFQSQILDQDLVESAIIEFDTITARYQYYINNIYDCVLSMLSGKYGLIRSSMLSRTIEFSARSVIIVDPSIEPYQVKVSPNILSRLWTPYFLHYLTKVKNMDFDECYESFVTKELYSDEYKKKFMDFLNWMQQEDEE